MHTIYIAIKFDLFPYPLEIVQQVLVFESYSEVLTSWVCACRWWFACDIWEPERPRTPRCGYLQRLLLFRCHQAPLTVIIPPEMLRSCWFVQTVFDFSAIPIISKKYFPFNVLQELLVSGPLWQTERANQNFILQVGIREIPKSMPTNWCDSNCRDGKAEGQKVCLPSLSELLTLFWTPSLRLTEFSTRCEKGP